MEQLTQMNIETLIAIGAFSPQNAAFLKNNQYRSHGLPPQIAPDIAVLDVVWENQCFVGFADGHVQVA